MRPTSRGVPAAARTLSHMPPIRRIAVACVAAVLLVSGGSAAWGDSTHNLRQQKRQAARHAAQLDQRAQHQAAGVADAQRALARLNDRATAALAALQHATLTADRARAASAAAEQHLAAAQAHTEAARAQLND